MDNCCAACKGAHGICLSRYTCNHHLEADAQDEINHRTRQTYSDPTANAAIRAAMAARNPKRRARYKEN
jgi:transposase-like protein